MIDDKNVDFLIIKCKERLNVDRERHADRFDVFNKNGVWKKRTVEKNVVSRFFVLSAGTRGVIEYANPGEVRGQNDMTNAKPS